MTPLDPCPPDPCCCPTNPLLLVGLVVGWVVAALMIGLLLGLHHGI